MMHDLKLHTKILLLTFLLAISQLPAHATASQPQPQRTLEHEADSIAFSLITCGQGDEIYSLFGHTAIRYRNPLQQVDVVFNYGVFDFNTPHFVLRFALGQTDYLLGVNDFSRFCASYTWMGRSVSEQLLNLTSKEKLQLLRLLEENYRPENRTYRYNFFFDNCATRPRNLIERAITSGTLHYAQPMDQPLGEISFRSLIHRYSTHARWSRLGMDLCLGSKADRPITRREMEFVPFCLRDDLRQATIIAPDGSSRPLVIEERRWNSLPETYMPSATAESPNATTPEEALTTRVEVQEPGFQLTHFLTPEQAALLLLLMIIGATLMGTLRRRQTLWILDLFLLASAGLAGCILAFLSLLSEHPCVDSNWLLLALHPLHLACLPCALRRIRKGVLSRYQVVNLGALTLFIIVSCLKIQIIPLSAVYLALCLLVRALANIWLSRHIRPTAPEERRPLHTRKKQR